MKKQVITFLLCVLSAFARSQSTAGTQPYGKIDIADLEMKTCDFEKDANAEVLFHKGDMYFDWGRGFVMTIHKRIKIFNDYGKNAANIHINFLGGYHLETITGLQAETFNLVDGKIEITKLDKSLIYYKSIDKLQSEMVFSLPNIKPGSIIEYTYKSNMSYFPIWFFQEKIPVRYSEIDTEFPDNSILHLKTQDKVNQPYIKYSKSTSGTNAIDQRALANIPSLPYEPYMSSFADNMEYLIFQFSIESINKYIPGTWKEVGSMLADNDDFGRQLNKRLANEDIIIKATKALKTDDEKIIYLYNTVKNTVKWNDIDAWYTNDGTPKAWENKSGNSTEVNLILYHLLKQAGINAYPMAVSTQRYGKVIPFYTSAAQFNRTVVYIPSPNGDYVLDATGKYNIYNKIPADLLNSAGLCIDEANQDYKMIYLHNELPIRQAVFISGEIKPDGKLSGTAQISSFGYNRINVLRKYNIDGEKKYIDSLSDNDNNLKISSVKFENMEVDTLPLVQNIDFNLDLTGSDDTYIYLNPNLFTSLKSNPFLSETRMTDIDFQYLRNYNINGVYKIPAGYKVDALPKSESIVMPDRSVTFRRIIIEQDGSISVRYTIDYKKQIYSKEDYPEFHAFFKKMSEMLNEQIVLKKS